MNDKHRSDALRVFISGLKRNLTDVLFAAQPADLPSALAMAQEIEANHERHAFATQYARSIEEKHLRQAQNRQLQRTTESNHEPTFKKWVKNPFFTRDNGGRPVVDNRPLEKMDVDPTLSRFCQLTNFQRPQGFSMPQALDAQQHSAQNRPTSSQRMSDFKRQRVNHLFEEDRNDQKEDHYNQIANDAVDDIDGEEETDYESDSVHFLGVHPCFRSSSEQ